MSDKITYIQSSEHAIIGESGSQAATLAPGERVLFNEDADSHKYLKRAIEARDKSVAHLSLVEVDPEAEEAAEEERAEMAEKADKIAAEARAEEARANEERVEQAIESAEGQSPHADPTDFPPQDEEAQKIARQSGVGQRASTQADVADEDKPKRSGRRKASSSDEE